MPDEPATSDSWLPLGPLERRVLGVLIEKQKTSKSPDAYPMSLNSITTGCNQKSNRDPVMDLSEEQVEDTLGDLQKKLLVTRLTGSRVDRFRHMLYEHWSTTKLDMAVLAELLLRGPQTKGELRGRAARMEPIDTLEALEELLRPLAARKLVVYLTDPDRRGAMLTHGFHKPEELDQARTHAASAPVPAESMASLRQGIAAPTSRDLESKLGDALAEIEKLRSSVEAMAEQLTAVKRHIGM